MAAAFVARPSSVTPPARALFIVVSCVIQMDRLSLLPRVPARANGMDRVGTRSFCCLCFCSVCFALFSMSRLVRTHRFPRTRSNINCFLARSPHDHPYNIC
jgi:hypothetical protein